ncbi:MAG: hypothetical protein IRY94_18010 [Rhodospirillaceae bacterium]|nr:hypothetical protein [Rhodospirillaceae bacterium]
MRPDDVAVAIVGLNGGELAGRTRMQKTAFLLEQAGMRSGLGFIYHHYGPFSADLARGWEEAEVDERLVLHERIGPRGVPLTVFSTREPAPDRLGDLPADTARALLALMERRSDVVLELAATIAFLARAGADPIEEVKVRKPHKATPERLRAAQALLASLGSAATS